VRHIGQAKPPQTSLGEQDGVIVAVHQLAQAGVDVAADGRERQVGPGGPEEGHPPRAAGADPGAMGQLVKRPSVGRDQRIARVLAAGDGHQVQPGRRPRRHVLEAVDRQVDRAAEQGRFELLDEDARAPVAAGGVGGLGAVAAGRDQHDLDLQV
jgi:hypothetical protein